MGRGGGVGGGGGVCVGGGRRRGGGELDGGDFAKGEEGLRQGGEGDGWVEAANMNRAL